MEGEEQVGAAKTFSQGGVHPPEEKLNGTKIEDAPLPREATVPLLQHIGVPARRIVEEGDIVREGQLIGSPDGRISAAVHAPLPGRVSGIGEITLPNATTCEAVTIALGGEFFSPEKAKGNKENWRELSSEELRRQIEQNGVVGQGGATFPTHVKLIVPQGRRCDYLILNGAECEPYLVSDAYLMRNKAREIAVGIAILQKVLVPQKTVVGIEVNKAEAIEAMRNAILEEKVDCQVVPLKVKYPQGAEKKLIKVITGREVPTEKLPITIGVVNFNVATAFSVYGAVMRGRPVIARVVTVAGRAIKNPKVLWTRIGTPVNALIQECGGFAQSPERVIIGGPMMGFTVEDLATPVTKGTSGILALTGEEVGYGKEVACLRCGACLQGCPMGLQASRLVKLVRTGKRERTEREGIMDCIECGACEYSCPSRIPLVSYLRRGKLMVRKQRSRGQKRR